MKLTKILETVRKEKTKTMSKEMREQIDRAKNWEQFLNENTTFQDTINNINIVLNIFGNSLTLYDMSFLNSNKPIDGVLGCIGLDKNKNGFFEVLRIAGQKGYGKIMYILAMEFTSPKPIMISRDGDIRENAFNVIKKIFDNPPNGVRILQKTKNDDGYVDCLDWGCDDEDELKDFFKVYNTEFYSKKTYINKYKIINNKKIDDYGHSFFNGVYD